MSNEREYNNPTVYQIRVKGCLDPKWSDWFYGFTISEADEDTILTGIVTDQSALHGLLAKIRDLGLPIRSVVQMEKGVGSSEWN